jgi:hypothetical protein
MMRIYPIRFAIVAAVAACVGCPGSLEDPGRFTSANSSCPDVPQAIFKQTCSATAGCHSATDKQLGLDLQSANVASRLVGIKAMGGGGVDYLVDPTNPSKSVIYTKLTAFPPFGARMPFSETPLDDATIACVLQWITTQVNDGGSGDGSVAEASDDGTVSTDDGSMPGDDGSSASDDASGDDGATPPPMDAGHDARAPKDSGTTVDASVKDSGAPVDAGAG